MSDIARLKELLKDKKVLYAEDNDSVRDKATKLFLKICDKKNLFVAKDGLEGYELYKKNHPQIIVTDIKMPILDGFEMITKIREISANVKIIVTTGYDDVSFLHQAIKNHIFDYLIKPIALKNFVSVLIDCVTLINQETLENDFFHEIKSIFDYQNNLIVLLEDNKPILANTIFLDFFDCNNIEDFNTKIPIFSQLFKDEKNTNWYEEIEENLLHKENLLYNCELIDKYGREKNFLLSVKRFDKNSNKILFSMSDITSLGLKKLTTSELPKDKHNNYIVEYFNLIEKNKSNITLYNSYNEVTITNLATITNVGDNYIYIKTETTQLKALYFEKKVTISSDLFPNDIEADVRDITFEMQEAKLDNFVFADSSIKNRNVPRIKIVDKNLVQIVFKKNIVNSTLIDISTTSLKVKMDSLYKEFEKDVKVNLKIDIKGIVLDFDMLIPEARVVSIKKIEEKFYVVFSINLKDDKKREMTSFISKKQMEIIREFKKKVIDE